MRLHLRLSPNTTLVPYTYPRQLTGAFHALAGRNEVHDGLSLYSFSWLEGTNSCGMANGLTFPKGALWSISVQDETLARRMSKHARQQPEIAFGMRVFSIGEEPTPLFGSVYRFEVGSPVLVRKPEDSGRQTHLLYDNPEADAYLTQTMRSKLEAAGFSHVHRDVMVGYDRSYLHARTKLVQIKGTKYRCSVCPVIVAGTPEAVQFAWNVGVGHLTGNGLGFLK